MSWDCWVRVHTHEKSTLRCLAHPGLAVPLVVVLLLTLARHRGVDHGSAAAGRHRLRTSALASAGRHRTALHVGLVRAYSTRQKLTPPSREVFWGPQFQTFSAKSGCFGRYGPHKRDLAPKTAACGTAVPRGLFQPGCPKPLCFMQEGTLGKRPAISQK